MRLQVRRYETLYDKLSRLVELLRSDQDEVELVEQELQEQGQLSLSAF